MRHGNNFSWGLFPRFPKKLRSYLWGMETLLISARISHRIQDSDPTYEAWKPPARNTVKTILRNSDPTYEAWKLFPERLIHSSSNYSDPTYEAWKHTNDPLGDLKASYSDPTYEAWKLMCQNILPWLTVTPILPMRHGNWHQNKRIAVLDELRSYLWGMETRLGRNTHASMVSTPILPMRHGNRHQSGHPMKQNRTPILPMRHGNQGTAPTW